MQAFGYVAISHDPFARTSVIRTRSFCADSCSWCGGRPGRFVYGIARDDSSRYAANFTRGAFCCIDCWRSYVGN